VAGTAPTANLLPNVHIQIVMPKDGNERDAVIPNHILRSIPKAEYDVLYPHLEPVSLPWHQVLHQSHQPIVWGYFPNGGVVSLIVPMNDGK